MDGHALCGVCAQVGDLVMDVGGEGQAGRSTTLRDVDHIVAVQFHRH